MEKTPPRPVGIDLGTTFSAIAYVDERGSPQSVLNAMGNEVTPSAVLINPDRSIVVGEEALLARRTRCDRVAVNFKRDMGERYYHEPIGGKEFSPEALSALVLKKLAKDAHERIEELTGAVITVPAYFGDAKRKATQDAGRIAGLDVLDIINEPTAAALANAFKQYLALGGDQARLDIARIATTAPATTLIYDLGGGTFDVTIIRIDSNDFEVVATGGEVRLGGIDFDQRLVDYYCEEFLRRHGTDPRDTPESLEKIRSTCELAKIALSRHDQTVIVGEYLGRSMKLPISRMRFEAITADLLARTQISTEMVLEDALLNWNRIDNILLVGGSSRMPRVGAMLAELSGKSPDMAIAPQQIVAHGAAIHAAILRLDQDGITAATRGATAPMDSGNLTFLQNTDEDDDGPDISPVVHHADPIFDQAVAEVARSVKLTDVNSHGLGIIVRSSREKRTVNSVIIPKNTPLPTTRVKLFGTEAANQGIVRLRVTEGQTRDPRGCTQIGECLIKDLPKGLPKGAPVEVTFKYDTSGRISVRAVELTHGVSAEVELDRASGSSAGQIEKLANAVAELDVE